MGPVSFVLYFLIALSLPVLILLLRSGFAWKKTDLTLPVVIYLFYGILIRSLGHSNFANAFYCWLLFSPVAFFRLHEGLNKKIPKMFHVFANFATNKSNRSAIAIIVGATAIVLAVIANGTGNSPGSSSDSPSPINSESVPPQQRQILPSRANGGCPTGTTGISSSYCKAYGDTQYIPTDQYGGCPTGATGAGAGYCRLYR